MVPSSSPSNSLFSTKEPGLKTPRRNEIVNDNTKSYHSEPWPTRIPPSVSQGHPEHLSLPKQEDTDLLSKSVWLVSWIYFTVESLCFILFIVLSSNYLGSQAPNDRSPHKHSLGSQGQSFQNVSSLPHTAIQEDLHLPFHSLHYFWQSINLWREEVSEVILRMLNCSPTQLPQATNHPPSAE